MSRQFATRFYRSKSWRKTRDAYMNKIITTKHGMCTPGMCESCYNLGIYRPAEIVHHKIWLTPENITDAQITLAEDNLMRVCRDCHAQIHKFQYRHKPKVHTTSRVAFNEFGEVVPIHADEQNED